MFLVTGEDCLGSSNFCLQYDKIFFVLQISVDRGAMEVTVKGGTALKQLVKYLDDQGLAMKNLGSILEQTVAGAISTGKPVR